MPASRLTVLSSRKTRVGTCDMQETCLWHLRSACRVRLHAGRKPDGKRSAALVFVALGVGLLTSACSDRIEPARVGAYLGDDVLETRYAEYVARAGCEPAYLLTFVRWADSNGGFPQEFCDFARSHGAVPVITWEPWDPGADWDAKLADIAAGKHDRRIILWAQAAAEWSEPILIRFAQDMNGDRYPWSTGSDSRQRAEDYVRAWRHVHRMFNRLGASNVEWLWCPYCEPAEGLERLYPGDRFVDWIGIDVYNGPRRPRSPSDALDPVYRFARARGKPILLAEVGCAGQFDSVTERDPPWSDKARWITAMFQQVDRRPEIRGLIWFDVNREADWRVNSSPEAAAAYRKAVLRLQR